MTGFTPNLATGHRTIPMTTITTATNPEVPLTGLAKKVSSLGIQSCHVKNALHTHGLRVHILMLENRVRKFREERKLTQYELAEAINVSRQTIHSIENSKALPNIEIAIKMALAMKARVEDLFFISKTRNTSKRRLAG